MFDAANLHVENHEILGAKPRMPCFFQETIVLEEKTRIQDWSQSKQELSHCALQHLHLSIILSLLWPFGMVIGDMGGRR
jgi:hypothetical protein